MTAAGPQAMFVVEYPCDRFCRIEVDLSGENGQVTLQKLRERADGLHEREHDQGTSTVDQEPAGRPASTVFLAAPERGGNRRR